MTRRSKITVPLLALAALLLVFACASGGGSSQLATRPFPEVKVPSLLPQDEVSGYVLDHFWDAYLDTTDRYLCDSTHVGGVDERVLASQLASYLSFLENYPPEKAQPVMEAFFSQLERYQAADTSSNVFSWMTESVDYYLYDPNSDIRSEELYLPFVSRLAASPLTREDLRARYAHAAEVCATNRIGAPAPDFRFIDAAGRVRSLYGEKKASLFYILLFINPGCEACEEVVSAFDTEFFRMLQIDGDIEILGIYIDEDISAWQARSDKLPSLWVNGYDPDGIIRSDRLYYVRAIPSIYVLDKNRRILLKDAPPQTAVSFIENYFPE